MSTTDTTWTSTDLATAEARVREAQAEVTRLRAATDAEILANRDAAHDEAERATSAQGRELEPDARTADEGRAAARARIAADPRKYGVTAASATAPEPTNASDPEIRATTAEDGRAAARARHPRKP